nr:neuroblastoma breakpoint family member 11-like [Dasypus novemcinctus]
MLGCAQGPKYRPAFFRWSLCTSSFEGGAGHRARYSGGPQEGDGGGARRLSPVVIGPAEQNCAGWYNFAGFGGTGESRALELFGCPSSRADLGRPQSALPGHEDWLWKLSDSACTSRCLSSKDAQRAPMREAAVLLSLAEDVPPSSSSQAVAALASVSPAAPGFGKRKVSGRESNPIATLSSRELELLEVSARLPLPAAFCASRPSPQQHVQLPRRQSYLFSEAEEYKDILESVLGEKLQFEEGELAEKPGPAARLRKYISPIHNQLQELIQIRLKLQVGRDVSYMLHQLFRDLLSHNESDNCQWPSFQEKLDQGCKLADCLYHKLQSDQARELTQLRKKLREGRWVSDLLNQHLKDLLTHKDSDSHQIQCLPEQLAEGHRLAEHLHSKLSTENHEDEEDKEEQESAPSPGLHSCVTCFSMAVSLCTSCAPRTEMSIQEINQELCSQLAKSKQDFRDLTEKFLISQATAYSLANQLQKYKPGQYKDILESVLGEKLQFEEEELAEKPGPAVRLRKHISPIHDQLQELIQMRQKLQVGRDVSYKLHQLFRDLLTNNEPDSSQWLSFREKLDQGGKLAECLYHELQSENPEAVEGEEELLLAARLKSQTEEAEKKNEVLQDSVEECYLTPSSLHDLPDSLGPRRSSGFLFDDYKFDLAVDEVQNPEAGVGEEGLLPAARLKSQTEEAEKENEVLQDSVEECYLTPSSLHDLPDSLGPRRSSGFLFDDYKFDLAVDEAQNQSSHKDERGKESMALSRLFMEHQDVEGMNETEEDKLDEDNLTPFHCHDYPDAHQPPSSTTFMSDEQGVCSPLSAAKHQSYQKDEKGQESMGPRLFRKQQEAEGMNETEQDTRDEQHSSDFLCHELPDAHQPPCSTTLMSDEQEVCSSLSAAKNQKKYQDIKRNKPVVLMKYHFLIQYQARELSQLRKNLREGRWVSDFLDEHLKGLLTHKDSDNLHMHHLPEKLTELHRLTERLYSKISAGKLATDPTSIELLQILRLTTDPQLHRSTCDFDTYSPMFQFSFGALAGSGVPGYEHR